MAAWRTGAGARLPRPDAVGLVPRGEESAEVRPLEVAVRAGAVSSAAEVDHRLAHALLFPKAAGTDANAWKVNSFRPASDRSFCR